MKKKIIIIIVFFLLGLISGIGFYCYQNENIRFKLSYEYINYMEYSNGKKIEVSIPLDNKIEYLSEKELINFLKNGTGVLYLGYNTCPWCRNAVPVLIDVIKEKKVDTIYYADIHKLDISSIREELYSLLNLYLEENDEGEKVLAVPDVYFMKNGSIIGEHRGTVDSYHNPYQKMTDSQKTELKTIYKNFIEEMELWEN